MRNHYCCTFKKMKNPFTVTVLRFAMVCVYSVRGLERSELGSHEIRPIHYAPSLVQNIEQHLRIYLLHFAANRFQIRSHIFKEKGDSL